MDIEKLRYLMERDGYSNFRIKQAKKAVYFRLISSWDEASDLSEELRKLLKNELPISSFTEVRKQESKDSLKLLLKTNDGQFIETVLMRHLNQKQDETMEGRNTICISSQAGCPMGCSFCATGKMGLKRNLTAEEIVDQVLHFARILKKDGSKVNNIVFMGMGEPFNNYDNVMLAIKTLNDKDGFNIGIRHISVSTCGIVPAIKKFADEETQVNLAISLHAPNDKIRNQIMPINKAYNIKKLLDAVDYYIEKTNRKVMFEYILIDGVNDSEENARELAKLMHKKLYHLNLIKYHDTGVYKSTSKDKRRIFFDILKKAGVSTTFRISFGEDISAACGQLSTKEVMIEPNVKK
ncbi:MAG: 23S rRNA (adenine(2503)-C(2))-methyltransferase RlmN [Patescibacteria group bacterium]